MDEKRKEYGRTQKAIEEILKQCKKENILTPFLASRQKEVQNIMVTLFDQKRVLEIHDYNVAREAEQKGIEKGIEKGLSEAARKLAKAFGFSVSTPI